MTVNGTDIEIAASATLDQAIGQERCLIESRVQDLMQRVLDGYQAGIKLLRAGAHLVVTTRFPRDSAQRYAAEPDFAAWGERLEIFGLDLRHTPSV